MTVSGGEPGGEGSGLPLRQSFHRGSVTVGVGLVGDGDEDVAAVDGDVAPAAGRWAEDPLTEGPRQTQDDERAGDRGPAIWNQLDVAACSYRADHVLSIPKAIRQQPPRLLVVAVVGGDFAGCPVLETDRCLGPYRRCR